MKKLLSAITILMLVTTIAQSSFALDKQKKSGGQSDYKPKEDQPDPPNPNPKDSPYILVYLQSRIEVSGVQWAQSLGEASRWNFRTELVNKSNIPVPKGTKIEYTYTSNMPGYFPATPGGESVKGAVVLQEALPANGTLYLGIVVFATTKNPAKIICTAHYKKKK